MATDFGILAVPRLSRVPPGIRQGKEWAADNEAFTGNFDPTRFFPWLDNLKPWRENCLFITVPDVLMDPEATLREFDRWAPQMKDWPLAFVAQDGQEHLPFPKHFDALFVGGSTEWKMGPGAENCIREARNLGKHIHIGRVNFFKRYAHFAAMEGGKEFTCDGTRYRFEGQEKVFAEWASYKNLSLQIRLDFLDSHRPS